MERLRLPKELPRQFLLLGRTRLAFGPTGPEPTGAKNEHPRSVAEILSGHVTLELEGIDRTYLNV